MAKSDMEKLEALLQHWVEHNREHSGEFGEWAEKAGALGHTEVRDEILRAVEQMDKANPSLLRALESVKEESSRIETQMSNPLAPPRRIQESEEQQSRILTPDSCLLNSGEGRGGARNL